MSGTITSRTIPYSEILLKTERKKLKELSILYTNAVLYAHYLQRENNKADRRYYKLLKKYKRLKKELEMCEARWKMVEPPVRLSNAVEDVLKKEWDTPEEDKAWEGLLDSSSEVKE